MSDTKKSLLPVLIIAALLVVAGGAYFITQNKGETTIEEPQTAETAAVATTEAPTTQTQASGTVDIDVNAAMSERALGNPEAPIVIREFASLTCGHCGDFHKNVFKQLKAEYIDTGKVYFVFNDFPLNGPAVHASMVARCLPADRYFSFIGMLFDNQEKWAYDQGYINYLRQNAALAGLGNDAFESCIGNDELRVALLGTIRESQNKYNISSTPTLVINETDVHTGARNFGYYKEILDAKLASADAAPEETAPAVEAPATETEAVEPAAEEPAAEEPAATETTEETAPAPETEAEPTTTE